jgi:hypothetical protein
MAFGTAWAGVSYTTSAERLQAFEVTSRTCVLAFKAERQRLAGTNDPTCVEMERISALPAVCTPPLPARPLGILTSSPTHSRSTISPSILRCVLARMRLSTATSTGSPKPVGDNLAAITDKSYIRWHVVALCRGKWQYGLAEDGIGYLRILSFEDYSQHGYNGDVNALNQALDRILGDAALRALIIDARLSFVGDDHLGLCNSLSLDHARVHRLLDPSAIRSYSA